MKQYFNEIKYIIKCSRSIVSAPGFLEKEKVRSPLLSNPTKASVVNCLGSWITAPVSMPSFSSVSIRKRPCMSSPTFAMRAVFHPKQLTAVSILAGAPPGFCSKSRIPSELFPDSVKSISNSPSATTS